MMSKIRFLQRFELESRGYTWLMFLASNRSASMEVIPGLFSQPRIGPEYRGKITGLYSQPRIGPEYRGYIPGLYSQPRIGPEYRGYTWFIFLASNKFRIQRLYLVYIPSLEQVREHRGYIPGLYSQPRIGPRVQRLYMVYIPSLEQVQNIEK